MKKIKKILLVLLLSVFFIPSVSAVAIDYNFVDFYFINFNSNSGTGYMPIEKCPVNQKCKLLKNEYKKKGYTFKNWNTKKNGKGKSYKNKEKVLLSKKGYVDKNLYAQWTANKYTIKFNGNGATSGSTKKISTKYGKKVTLTKNGFKRTGYTFVGWNTKKDGSGKTYKNKASVKNLTAKNNGTVTLYAQWKKNNSSVAGTYFTKTSDGTYYDDYITLKKDNTFFRQANFLSGYVHFKGTYSVSGNTITFKVNGQKVKMTIDNNKITSNSKNYSNSDLYYMVTSGFVYTGTKTTFVKGNASKIQYQKEQWVDVD